MYAINKDYLKKLQADYAKLITNITREPYRDQQFIGGLPITLEKKDIFTILSRDNQVNYSDSISTKNFRYSITQKVDGTRFLMFVNSDIDGKSNVTFIDRNNNFYELSHLDKGLTKYLPSVSISSKLLIDGELVIFGDDDKIITPSSDNNGLLVVKEKIKMFSFMAFDILYGPINIQMVDNPLTRSKEFKIETGGAMAGPIGGRMWPYEKRYDILQKLLIPDKNLNNFKPPLTIAFKECNWFIPEIKPLYFMDQLNIGKNLYSPRNGFFQVELEKFRKDYYQKLHKMNEKDRFYRLIKIELDGLIFTPWTTPYVIYGAWNKFLNKQYKWKPTDQQSIDFKILPSKIPKQYTLNISNINMRDGIKNITIEPFIMDEKVATVASSALPGKLDGEIGEFIYDDSTKKFIFLKLRKDKLIPNSIKVAKNVINAIKNPVDINKVKKFFNVGIKDKKTGKYKLPDKEYPDLLKYMNTSQLLQCVINNNQMKLLNKDNLNKINALITDFKSPSSLYVFPEFEIRFGKILSSDRGNVFNSNISFITYKKIIDIVSIIYKEWTLINYRDYYTLVTSPDGIKRNIRTRYIYDENFKNFRKLNSIYKKNINNIDINFKKDKEESLSLRYSLSDEINEIIPHDPINNQKENKNYYEKIRYSFPLNNGAFSLDLTEIINIKILEGKKQILYRKYQVELEAQNNQIDINDVNNILLKILNLLNE
tara:strand:- start:2960 stop:5089 length:2130 start_codon:yes stop_codon:yes gene_type:complete